MLSFKRILISLTLISTVLILVVADNKPCKDGLGQCVPVTRCRNGTEAYYGKIGVFNIRLELQDADKGECHYLETCCDHDDVIPKNLIEPKLSAVPVPSVHEKLDQCIQKCHDESKIAQNDVTTSAPDSFPATVKPALLTNEVVPTAPAPTCGHRHEHGIGFEQISDPGVAQFGEFPWQVALLHLNGDDAQYFCGGSLIHPSVVLTAAHCVNEKQAQNIQVRAGEWDTKTTNEPLPHLELKVKDIIVHPEFGPKNLVSDIALLILDTPAKMSSHINTVCLPPQNTKSDGLTCLASGWGADEFAKAGSYRVNPKKRALPTIQLRDCQSRLRNTKLGQNFRMDPSFMCAGGGLNVDTCVGDGGSALACPIRNENGRFYQSGIVSWGMECGGEGIPGVYTNVAKFRNWIDAEVTAQGFLTYSYEYVEREWGSSETLSFANQ